MLETEIKYSLSRRVIFSPSPTSKYECVEYPDKRQYFTQLGESDIAYRHLQFPVITHRSDTDYSRRVFLNRL